ncbi:MAG: SCP2 sterol-binding domain-containing protein [Acidobacteria bacterium]|nr:SCP2 sterol-binding domain-containing protein [Acidobacteriota bacterium]MBI3655804.1 SCP2 sterol-binding domain-containing protein [Acidobacteriota bacterium]
MAHTFPSDAWVKAFRQEINQSDAYRNSAATWDAGDLCLVITANPALGLKEDYYIWLDLDHGVCKKAKHVSSAEGEAAKFTIRADYDRWKQIFNRELHPIMAMVQGKLKVKGHLFIILKYKQAAQDLVECASNVVTKFIDE